MTESEVTKGVKVILKPYFELMGIGRSSALDKCGQEIEQALFNLLAAEAVKYLVASWAKEKDGRITVDTVHGDELAVPLSVIKEVFGVKSE